MFTVVTPEEIQLSPGSVLQFPGNWQVYQALSQRLGDRPNPRLKFRNGEILLMNPLPEHGRTVDVLADVVKVLLDHLEQEYDSFTPITMELPEESGIEPDHCFYIEHWAEISGKTRINWGIDPPPDLVIEIDVTSYTNVDDYLPYKVPEVWLFKQQQLSIYQFTGGSYRQRNNSAFFPGINLADMIRECMQIAVQRNTSAAMRSLRRKLEP
ncbi:MAG: Uma2 family endonuclease [Thermosynechococcaceae cyanobacterium]